MRTRTSQPASHAHCSNTCTPAFVSTSCTCRAVNPARCTGITSCYSLLLPLPVLDHACCCLTNEPASLHLHLHRGAFLAALAAPKSSSSTENHDIVSPLIEFLIAFLNPATWTPLVGPQAAAATCSSICSQLLQQHMYAALASLLQAVAPSAQPASTSYAETLTTQLTARHMALRAAPRDPSQAPQQLLLVPQLWQRFPSLRPIAGHIARQSVTQLARMSAQQVSAQLPAVGRARAGVLLLANLIQAGPKMLQGDQPLAVAMQTVTVLSTLLALLPLRQLLASVADSSMADEPSEQHASGNAASSSGPVAPLAWQQADGSITEAAAELAQLSEQPGKQLLQQLAQVLLPHTGPAARSTPAQLEQYNASVCAAFTAEQYAGGWAYCCLMRQLLALPGHRQRLLLGMAVSGGLVGRLWHSMVQPAQQLLAAGKDLEVLLFGSSAVSTSSAGMGASHSRPQQQAAPTQGPSPAAGSNSTSTSSGGSTSSSSSTAAQQAAWQQLQDNGLMLPALILSQGFSSFMSTADLAAFYDQEQPLALAALVSPSDRSRGLVPLLNDMLWRLLWMDADRVPASSAAAALRLEAAEHCGRLLEQLYDRNCRRAFCSTEAFHAELPPDRFMAEAGSSRPTGAAPGAAGSWPEASGRVWSVLRHAPCLVPFQERAKLLQREVEEARQEYREMELAAQVGGRGEQDSLLHGSHALRGSHGCMA